MKHLIHEAALATSAFVAGLIPSALGAAVSLAYEAGLTWRQRFVQLSVGVCVSYFVGGAIHSITDWSAFVLQAIQFVTGMIAYKATPRITHALVERVAEIPAALIDRFLPRGDRS
ncbi:hypothetical protein [Sphingomonas sp. 8AM]|uniref:hypothetical protein n=1 Tax=Sphingomonas sp. 8AM TaxID=2653170 RepID=UPI0012F2C3C5|nr:hypothetical protein [Sphingomonas sp. 8AM]VXC90777.1 conserved hypothetical protein [Sphingomonas sp. 8AM]